MRESCLADDSHLVAFNPQLHLSVAPGAAKGKVLPPYISFPSLTNGELLAAADIFNSSAAAAAGTGSALTARSVSGDGEEWSSSSSSTCGCNNPIELWVLLSRHVRERQKDLSTKYLAVHIHEGSTRVACPPPPAKQGVYSNGECTLVKVRLDPKALCAAAAGTTNAVEGAAAAAGNSSSRVDGNPAAAQQQQLQQQGKAKTEKDAFGSSLLKALDYVLVVSQYSQKVRRIGFVGCGLWTRPWLPYRRTQGASKAILGPRYQG